MRPLRDESGFTLPEVHDRHDDHARRPGRSREHVRLRAECEFDDERRFSASQSNLIVAVNRIEFEARCASNAALVSGGAGVTLTLPSYCVNAAGTYTWCVTSGSLVRLPGSSCTGSGLGWTFATNLTSATPFSCITGGKYPRLQAALTSNAGTTAGSAATGTTIITLRNAATSGACA